MEKRASAKALRLQRVGLFTGQKNSQGERSMNRGRQASPQKVQELIKELNKRKELGV